VFITVVKQTLCWQHLWTYVASELTVLNLIGWPDGSEHGRGMIFTYVTPQLYH